MMINFGMTGIKAENSLWGCLLKLKGRGERNLIISSFITGEEGI